VRKYLSNVDSLSVVVNRGDDARFVAANVEYRVRGDVVDRAERRFDRVKIRKSALLHYAKPCQERVFGRGMNFPELA
jgi:hypothetical protein